MLNEVVKGFWVVHIHRTTGRSLSTGRGATAAAFERRALRRVIFPPASTRLKLC